MIQLTDKDEKVVGLRKIVQNCRANPDAILAASQYAHILTSMALTKPEESLVGKYFQPNSPSITQAGPEELPALESLLKKFSDYDLNAQYSRAKASDQIQ